jgi:long-chain acyl-CoA synthetase
MNIASNLDHAAYHFPDHCAVIEGDRSVSFSEFCRDASQMASAMVEFGIQPGDHVALCAPNSYAWVVFYFGAIKAGAVAVTFLFTVDEKLEALADYRNRPYPELVVCEHGDISWARLVEKGSAEFEIIDRQRHDTAAILYTGGTTGIPKGAMLTHENLQTSAFNVAHYERSTEQDRALCFLPLSHVFGQVHIMHSTVLSGGQLILQPSFDLDKVLEAIDRHRVTKFYSVPTIYIRLLRLPDLRERLGSVRYCFSAAASMAIEVVREWKARTGLDIYEAYGLTESASMVTYNHYYRHVVGSVGTPANLVEVQIRDLEGKLLEQGQVGEICIRGPNVTKGYWNHPEETEAAFWKGNWFRSGDMGMVDESGYLYIVDRLKDMIITGGENVYPREVEEVLYTRPEVLECAVVGLPDYEYGEQVTAFIVPREGHQIDPDALKAYLKTRLAPYKVPKAYIAVDEMPKSGAGKVLKREIRRQHSGDMSKT